MDFNGSKWIKNALRTHGMKNLVKLDKLFDGSTWSLYTTPCIYGWFRQWNCLYIGQSKVGIARILGNHHIIDVRSRVQPEDIFKILFLSFNEKDSLNDIETDYIKKYEPCYNIAKNYNYEHNGKKVNKEGMLRRLPEKFRAETELAEVLLNPLPNQQLLETSYDCSGKSSEELEERCRDLDEHLRAFDKAIKQYKTT